MSILIKGMEMPTRCCDCKMYVEDIYYCPLLAREIENPWADDGVELDCPLISVPPHGRLIDADAFSSEMKERQTAAIKWMRESVQDHDAFIRAEATVAFLSEVKLTLDKMPTIIPAEEGET